MKESMDLIRRHLEVATYSSSVVTLHPVYHWIRARHLRILWRMVGVPKARQTTTHEVCFWCSSLSISTDFVLISTDEARIPSATSLPSVRSGDMLGMDEVRYGMPPNFNAMIMLPLFQTRIMARRSLVDAVSNRPLSVQTD